MADRQLVCKECGVTFVFTQREQDFYKEKNFENDPQRCPTCRTARKQSRRDGQPREMHTVTCSSCGKEAQVPFKPTEDKPVYCSECFQAKPRN